MEIDSHVPKSRENSANSPTDGQLSRRIGLLSLTLYGMGDILGAGIYGLVGKAAGQLGNAVWLAFLTSMIAAGLTGLSYAAVGSRYPRAAGAAYVTLKAFRRSWLSYVVGLAALASGLTSMATASRVFAGYLNASLPQLPLSLLIIGFLLLLAGIVYRGIRESMWMNAVCTIIEISGLVLIILVGASYLGEVNYMDARSDFNPSGDISTSLILGGAVLTFYSFIGFEDILNVSEEVKDPKRNVPRGLLFAVAGASLIYITISLIAVSVVPAADLAKSSQPLVDVMAVAAPWFPSSLYSMIAMFAVANTALLNYVMGSRLLYGMAHQGLLPSALGRVDSRTRTPHVAIATILAIVLLLGLSGNISDLAKATSVLLLACFILVNLSLIKLKLDGPTPPGTFDVPLAIPILGSLACLAMLVNAKLPEYLVAGGILLLIGVLYFVKRPDESAIERMDME
ncbi:MAG TPA: APC family permease [Pseudobdellovibrionaceae bacterium]|nr:APC family permease [Pseudobdellovibrionaceae bacterium]